jgi:hypothetical protein
MSLPWTYDDGGRAAAGFTGETRDCVTRAISIATGTSYREVYDTLFALYKARASRGRLKGPVRKFSPRLGVPKEIARRYLELIGWVWTSTMGIGTGCKVHLNENELPGGRLVVVTSKHYVAVVDGVAHDTHDPSRGGQRCVYGYWRKP